jgi:hypothetical protein
VFWKVGDTTFTEGGWLMGNGSKTGFSREDKNATESGQNTEIPSHEMCTSDFYSAHLGCLKHSDCSSCINDVSSNHRCAWTPTMGCFKFRGTKDRTVENADEPPNFPAFGEGFNRESPGAARNSFMWHLAKKVPPEYWTFPAGANKWPEWRKEEKSCGDWDSDQCVKKYVSTDNGAIGDWARIYKYKSCSAGTDQCDNDFNGVCPSSGTVADGTGGGETAAPRAVAMVLHPHWEEAKPNGTTERTRRRGSTCTLAAPALPYGGTTPLSAAPMACLPRGRRPPDDVCEQQFRLVCVRVQRPHSSHARRFAKHSSQHVPHTPPSTATRSRPRQYTKHAYSYVRCPIACASDRCRKACDEIKYLVTTMVETDIHYDAHMILDCSQVRPSAFRALPPVPLPS